MNNDKITLFDAAKNWVASDSVVISAEEFKDFATMREAKVDNQTRKSVFVQSSVSSKEDSKITLDKK